MKLVVVSSLILTTTFAHIHGREIHSIGKYFIVNFNENFVNPDRALSGEQHETSLVISGSTLHGEINEEVEDIENILVRLDIQRHERAEKTRDKKRIKRSNKALK